MTEIDWTLALRVDGSPGAIMAYADWLEESGAEQGVIDAVRQLPDFVKYLGRAIEWAEDAKGWSVRRMEFREDASAYLWPDLSIKDALSLNFSLSQGWKRAMALLHSRHSDGPVLAWFRAATGFSLYRHHYRSESGEARTRFVRDLEWVKA